MLETKLRTQEDKYLVLGRRFRLILGWFDIALGFYMMGFAIYLVITGKVGQVPPIAAAVVAAIPSGAFLVRSARESSLTQASKGLLGR